MFTVPDGNAINMSHGSAEIDKECCNMSESADISEMQNTFRVCRDTGQLADLLANELADMIRIAIAGNGTCHMVFPGGRSPRSVLERLAKVDLPWAGLHLYPSDERCLPVGDAERNDRLIDELLITQVPLPVKNLHRIPAELGPEEGAAQYCRLLNKTPPFDIVLLGVGPDGHTASLFPGHPALADGRAAVPVWNAPKLPPERVTIGLGRLLAARQRIVVATGSEKCDMIRQVKRGVDLPVARVKPTKWYLDAAAADNAEDGRS